MSFKGMGGHMTASLIHQIQWTRKVAKLQLAREPDPKKRQAIADTRDRAVENLQGRLRERGYFMKV